MRTWTLGILLAASVAAGCHSVKPAPSGRLPLLFPGGGEFIVTNDQGTPMGYVFAETDKKPGRQTLRWLLLEGFVSPTRQPLYIERMVEGGHVSGVCKSAAEFADMARRRMKSNPKSTYVKSYADTFSESYAPPGMNNLTIARLPVPAGRPAPAPKGQLPPADWADPNIGKPQQIDGGSVGIKPAPGPSPLPEPPPPAHGYLDPALLADVGVAGMAIASPQRESNTEYFFLSDHFFKGGLDQVSIFPFANQQATATAAPSAEWAVVVVNSSYYPGFVPNAW